MPPEPKPFLKKGTRKFLSNATVRSQTDKPLIVDMQQPPHSVQPEPEHQAEIRITVKKKQDRPPSRDKSIPLAPEAKKQNKQINQPNSTKPKKTTLLEDYMSKPSESKMKSMGNALQRQDELEDCSDEEEIKPIRKTNPLKSSGKKTVMRKVEDSSDEEQNYKQKSKDIFQQRSKNIAETQDRLKGPMRDQWEEEEGKQKVAQNEGKSKVLQKYYKKTTPQPQPQQIVVPKLTLKDIPAELKKQIFQEAIAGRKQELSKKLQELKGQIAATRKAKQKYEEDSRVLVKQREQFQKQMQEKNKEFQEKLKGEVNKLAREKKYMKDQQMVGKGDWKIKNELQQLKNALEQVNDQKKRIEVKFKGETDRLKSKLQDALQQNKTLLSQIQTLQTVKSKEVSATVNKLKEGSAPVNKIREVREISATVNNTANATMNNTVTGTSTVSKVKEPPRQHSIREYWSDAPQTSYVSKFVQDSFSLIDLQLCSYNLQNIEYYQYYLFKRDETGSLMSEVTEGNKITRKYQNGKQQQEYVGRGLRKQIFPFGFSVILYDNGDIKLSLPEGIQVYFDNRGEITEFKVSPTKVIYYFHKLNQAEMKMNDGRPAALHQVYYPDNTLIRHTYADGEVLYRRNMQGEVIKVKK